MSAVTVTAASPPAGTVSVDALSVNMPAVLAKPRGPLVSSARFSVTAAVPELWYVTVFVIGVSSLCGHCWSPKLTLAGDVVTVWWMARPMSTRPAPWANTPMAGFGLAAAMSAAFSWAGVQSGCSPARIAAVPATCGVAIEVPEIVAYRSPGLPMTPSLPRAAVMSTPGAVMSGLMAESPMRGPRLENSANSSFLVTAPTVSASSALPGEPTE